MMNLKILAKTLDYEVATVSKTFCLLYLFKHTDMMNIFLVRSHTLIFFICCNSVFGRNVFDCQISEFIARFVKVTLNGKEYLEDINGLTPNISTYLLFHGWSDNITLPSYYDIMAVDLLSEESCNVILVDYQYYATEFYTCAFKCVSIVGDYVGEFLSNAINGNYIQPENIHLIGQSLGAHVAGMSGRSVFRRLGKKIRRVSGLDPAGPLFKDILNNDLMDNALKRTDAMVVDVLHCATSFGIAQQMGTVDFYAKGLSGDQYAFFQKPCILKPFDVVCSHKMAKRYYDDSITSCGFKATPVGEHNDENQLQVYGHHMNESITGAYEFDVNYYPPYAKYAPYCS